MIFFAIVDILKAITVGSLAAYNFNEHSCEVGKIVIGDESAHGRGKGYKALLMAIKGDRKSVV